MNEFQQLIDKIIVHFVSGDFKDELADAKKVFFGNSGTLDEHSDHFESRMAQFYDWYFFTRPLRGYGRTPLASCEMVRELRFSEAEAKLLEILNQNYHSLFEFIKIKNQDIVLKDLFRNEKIIVQKSPWVFGFNEDEIFDVRLIPYNGTYLFMRGFCFHPQSAKKFILSEVKRHRKDPDLDPEALMLRLIKMRYKFEQYRHVKAELIYCHDSKLGV